MSNYIKEYKPHLEWWNNIPDEGDGLFITNEKCNKIARDLKWKKINGKWYCPKCS